MSETKRSAIRLKNQTCPDCGSTLKNDGLCATVACWERNRDRTPTSWPYSIRSDHVFHENPQAEVSNPHGCSEPPPGFSGNPAHLAGPQSLRESIDTGSGPLGDGVPCSWCNKLSCDGYCDGAVRDLKAQSYKTEGLLKCQDDVIEALQKRVADLEADRNSWRREP